MGARQSKRSVDITTTPKKGDGEAVGEEKIEKLGDADVKAVVTNGTAAHTDIEFADKDDEAKESEEKPSVEIKENGLPETSDGEKTPDKEAAAPAAGDQPVKTDESAAEKTPEDGEKVAETPDSKKQKEKKKKKWSLRSISFSKKDKSKPSKDKDKNGEVEEVNEEKAEEAVTSPTAEPVKADEAKTPVEEATTPVANGEASKEELAVKVPEAIAEVEKEVVKTPEEPAAVVEAPKDEPKVEPEAPAKVKECIKPVVEEPKPVEETPAVPTAVEEVKEVRSEEVPPPLPSSNPPSQVTVFAESTKANVLSVDDIPVSEKTESLVDEPASPKLADEPISKVESVAPIESAITPSVQEVPTIPSPVEAKASTPISSPVEDAPSSPVPSTVEVIPESPPVVESKLSVESLESEQKISFEQNDSIIIDPVSITESSPLIIEALPKQSEESLQDVTSEASGITLEKDDSSLNSLAPRESEASNLPVSGDKESNLIVSDQASLKTDNEDSMASVPSVPMMVEEKMPIVSSAGDVPNPLQSETSIQSNDSSLQELKSNLNLKDSPTLLLEPSLISEEVSDDLSTIAEVESRELKLEEENVNSLPEPPSKTSDLNELAASPTEMLLPEQESKDLETAESSPALPQKEIEPVCNADSLPDLSTESLPSLPEPTDSMLEPMSLPPLDSVPDPLVDDSLPVSPTLKPIETEPPVVLTNGNATNGLKSSPTADDDDTPLPPPLDGPLKQISVPTTGDACEISQTSGDAPVESVESAPAAAE